jgi:acyl carrier protein
METRVLGRSGVTVVTDDTDLLRAGLLDSQALLDVIMAMEMEFDITIHEARLRVTDVQSISALAALVLRVSADKRGLERNRREIGADG